MKSETETTETTKKCENCGKVIYKTEKCSCKKEPNIFKK